MKKALILFMIGFTSFLGCRADNEPTLKVGDTAPEFTIADTLGVMHSLSEHKNKWVVIDFWASWCGDCRREFGELKAAYERYSNKVRFISVSFDDNESAWKTCLRKEQFPWLQLCNLQPWKENVVSQAYGIRWIPTMFLVKVNPKGEAVVLGVCTSASELSVMIEKFIYPTDDEIPPFPTTDKR